MPVMDGYEAVSELRKKGTSTPALAFTSLQQKNILCHLRSKEFNDMVVKPFNPTDLRIRIGHCVC
jgi:CheY-like chemotaxis protein